MEPTLLDNSSVTHEITPDLEGTTVDHPSQTTPVFYDSSGKRWKRLKTLNIVLAASTIAILVWMVQNGTAPIWSPPLNQSTDYPRELAGLQSLDDIPILASNDNEFAFDRIALVEHDNGKVYLTDPFSNTVFRQATEAEVQAIGNSPYVMESFGKPADYQLMLTFDDGPDARFTPQILDLLSREGVPATFFVIGGNIVSNPDVFQRMIREGHMVANHTLSHANFNSNPDIRNREELIGNDHVMRAAGNYASRLFRIPNGDPESNPLALAQAQQLGYIHVNLDLDTKDWSYGPGETIPVPSLDGEGHIVLLHDGGGDRTETITMLERLIDRAKAVGYTFSTLQPILPSEYVPMHDVAPSVADSTTYAAMLLVAVAPSKLLGWLFWFGIVTLTVMSALYIVLALINSHRYNKVQWTAPDGPMPLVSVILPVFNEEPVVKKTLDSIRASDYPDIEVIAIDDGSTDGTLSVLREYEKEWPSLRVFSQANGGKSAATNAGLQHVRGEIIVTIDGDTMLEQQTIRMLARHFMQPDHKSGKPLGAVAGHVKVGNRQNVLTAWQSLEYISGICVTRMAESLVGSISIAPGACAAWSLDAVRRAGGYSDTTLAEDADLTLTLHTLGYRIVQENEAVAWTEAPMTVRSLAKQRLRWTYGTLQAIFKHRNMVLRPQHGVLGMVTLPYALTSFFVPLIFLPLTLVAAVVSLAQGNWQSLVIFAAFVTCVHLIISAVAIAMVRESPWHLLVVPIYRLIYEPLRAYLIYASVWRALKGRVVGWYRPERTNSVVYRATPAS